VQLVPSGDDADLALPEATGSACERCGRFKYLPLGRIQPTLRAAPDAGHLWRSREVFGSGASSHRLVLASGMLYERLAASGARGVTFAVVELAHAA
jgi:hypothetical protein